MGEVESKLVRPHGRARLAHVDAEPLSQRGVKKVCGGVVAHRRAPLAGRDDRLHPGSWLRQSGRHTLILGVGDAHPKSLVLPVAIDVNHPRDRAVPAQLAGVGNLAATGCVERALLELYEGIRFSSTGERLRRGDRRLHVELLEADETRRGGRRHEADHRLTSVDPSTGRGDRKCRLYARRLSEAGTSSLLLHERLEPRVLNGQALFAEQLFGHFVWEPVGIVEREGLGGIYR